LDYRKLSEFDEIILTGGEPLLYFTQLVEIIPLIKRFSKGKPIYIYTAYTHDVETIIDILKIADGITYTLHGKEDVFIYRKLTAGIEKEKLYAKSLRLNVFEGINGIEVPEFWKVKDNIKWLKDCPLPKNETFVRLNNLLEYN